MKSRPSAIRTHLNELYGKAAGAETLKRLQDVMAAHAEHIRPASPSLTERDAILITYGDQVREPHVPPLKTLARFCHNHLGGLVNAVHILPFYPYSSDDGFSVLDYRSVSPDLGNWRDIHKLGASFHLMFDAVINHASVQGKWFKRFLRGDPAYRDYFIEVEGDPDLSLVVRPRALPLLTRFDGPTGARRVWTTFSKDQADLNFKNPDVLVQIIDILLLYVAHGARFIRLDAIAYLWKEPGTPCIHLPQTHRVVQLIRAVLDAVAPHVMLITETNVPHTENISYFGDGHNEAQLVYNFALPPLVLHTLYTGNAAALSYWAASLGTPSSKTTFFNFLASHDGIGLTPVHGILSENEIARLTRRVVDLGGLISYKETKNGEQIPYELNVNYFDALSDHEAKFTEVDIDRFMVAQAIMLSLVGIPGIYFHSLFGSRGWRNGVKKTGQNRTINRQKLNLSTIESDLADPASLRGQVFSRYARLLQVRTNYPAFHPHGWQEILNPNPGVFTVLRQNPSGPERVLCLQNVTNRVQTVKIDSKRIFGPTRHGGWLHDLLTEQRFDIRTQASLRLNPYQILWLVREQRGNQ